MRVTFKTEIHEGDDFCEIVEITGNAYYTKDDGFCFDDIIWNDQDFTPDVNTKIQSLLPQFKWDLQRLAHQEAYGHIPYFLEWKFINLAI